MNASPPPRLLPWPGGPPLVELAAAAPDERHPVLLDGGAGRGRFDGWRLLALDPVEVVSVRAEAGGAPALQALADAMARVFPGVPPAGAAGTPAGGAGDGRPAEGGRSRGHGRGAAASDPAGRPPFAGGAAGWIGYDVGRQLERIPARAARDAELPDLHMGLYPFVLAEEVATGRRWIAGRGDERGVSAFAAGLRCLAARARPVPAPPSPRGGPASTFDRAGFMAAVEAVRERILDGDVYQVNLAQRLELAWSGRPESLHVALRASAAAPFAAVVRAPGHAVVSGSPELFLRRRGRRLVSRPIKGTRPRGASSAEDDRLRAELEASPKEIAELSMIVDLVRNDLGRVAALDSVEVALPFETDAWPTVFHRVAEVGCAVAPELRAEEILAATFPPASVTGTPKISALSVIEALEPVRRHVYTGAIGWIGADGDLDLSVAIRVATVVDGRLLVPVGGGITLLSDPADEYEETLDKARATLLALGLGLPVAGARP